MRTDHTQQRDERSAPSAPASASQPRARTVATLLGSRGADWNDGPPADHYTTSRDIDTTLGEPSEHDEGRGPETFRDQRDSTTVVSRARGARQKSSDRSPGDPHGRQKTPRPDITFQGATPQTFGGDRRDVDASTSDDPRRVKISVSSHGGPAWSSDAPLSREVASSRRARMGIVA